MNNVMTKQIDSIGRLKFLQHVNDSGADAVLDNIVRLIAEGFTVKIEPTILAGFDGDESLPAFTVTTLINGEVYGEGTSTCLMESMAEAYMCTPEDV